MTTTKDIHRRYNRELAGAILVYAIVLVAAISLVKAYPDEPWRYAVALAPVVPCFGIVHVILRWLRGTDELQRRIQLEALAFAFAAGSLATFAYGFLQTVGLPDVSWLVVWPVYAAFWVIGTWLAHRRYC